MLHAGFLALENMNYFAKKNRDFFSKVEISPLARVDFGSLCLTPFLQFSFFFDSTFWSKTAGRTERIARLQPLLWRSPSFCWNIRVFRAMVRFSPFVFFYFGPTFLFPFFSISFPFLPFSTQPTITIQCFWDLRTCTRTPCSPCLSFGLKCRPARATWFERELCLSLQLGFNWLFVLWSLDEGG